MAGFLNLTATFVTTHTRAHIIKPITGQEHVTPMLLRARSAHPLQQYTRAWNCSGPVIEWKVQASTDNVKCCHSGLFDDTGIIPFHSSIHPSSTASSLSGVAYPQMHVLLLWEEAAVHPQRCRKNMQTTEKSPLAPGDSDLCSFHSLLTPWMCRVNLFLLLLLCCVYARDWPINLVEEVLSLQ